MAWAWILAGIMLFVAALEWWNWPRVPKNARRVPAPRRYPIIGHFPQVRRCVCACDCGDHQALY